jgi:phosphoglycolate phosphatase-like HAD superfamily hydrolase
VGEQPIYFQFAFALDRVKAMAPAHPEWKTTAPFNAILSGDTKAFLASGEKGLMPVIAVTHAGMTTDEFAKTAADWLASARHPRFKKPYNELVYQPMLELLEYLRAAGFKTFIVSGGGIEFMRVFRREDLRHSARADRGLDRAARIPHGRRWKARVGETAADRPRR